MVVFVHGNPWWRAVTLSGSRTMRKNQKTVEHYVFPDEGHGLARPENNTAFNAAAEVFLASQLGGRAEPPTPAEAKLLDSVKQ